MNSLEGSSGFIIGIDALRSKSGGAKAHLLGVISCLKPEKYGIKYIHVWSYKELLEELPEKPWLIKHCPKESTKNILSQLLWQRFKLSRSLTKSSCDIVLNLDAGTVNTYSPAVTMSRDMLSYEPGEMQRYKYSLPWLRLLIIKYVQAWALKRASSVVFLTRYASEVIQKFTGPLKSISYIPHGVGSNFHDERPSKEFPDNLNEPIKCVYVSNVAPYKHQRHVIRAIKLLKEKGYDLSLELIGENKKYKNLIENELIDIDWITMQGHIKQRDLPKSVSRSDIFIFASSCENMPNTLVEGMAIGMPIACSDRGPMPEILEDGGLYFNPEDEASISECIEKIITNREIRKKIAARAKILSKKYSWEKCSDDTFSNLIKILKHLKNIA